MGLGGEGGLANDNFFDIADNDDNDDENTNINQTKSKL